jgi:hypothetical protein
MTEDAVPLLREKPVGVIVCDKGSPTPLEFKVQLDREFDNSICAGEFIVTQEDPRMFAQVSSVMPYHQYYTLPMSVADSLAKDYDLGQEAPATSGWTVINARVIGEIQNQSIVYSGRAPRPGQKAYRASINEISRCLNLRERGICMGRLVSRPDLVVNLDDEIFLKEHTVTFGVTRFGKSYSNAVVIEELSKAGRAILVIDPHGEYFSFEYLNDSADEVDSLPQGLAPQSFKTVTYSPPMFREGKEHELTVSFSELEASEIVELTGIGGENQIAVVYEAVRALRGQIYGVDEFIQRMRGVKEELGISVAVESISARLRVLQRGIGIFGGSFNPKEIIQPGQITVVNLSGLDLRAQQVLVTCLLRRLFNEKQFGNIPQFALVIDEAQRFAPEGSAPVSKPVIEEIAKEGLKFGISLHIMAQRPTEVSNTVRSESETKLFHRLSEAADVNYAIGILEKASPELVGAVTRLSKGEAILTGACTNYIPVRVMVRPRQSRHAGRTGTMRVRKRVTSNNNVNRLPRKNSNSALGQLRTLDAPNQSDLSFQTNQNR